MALLTRNVITIIILPSCQAQRALKHSTKAKYTIWNIRFQSGIGDMFNVAYVMMYLPISTIIDDGDIINRDICVMYGWHVPLLTILNVCRQFVQNMA